MKPPSDIITKEMAFHVKEMKNLEEVLKFNYNLDEVL